MSDYIEQRLAEIPQPGFGSLHGQEILARKEGQIAGVTYLRLSLEDKHNGERESLYLTEDGFEISPMYGEWGSGIRWGLTGSHQTGAGEALRQFTEKKWGHRETVVGTSNLHEAFALVARIREEH